MRRIFLVIAVIALLTVAAMPAMADHRGKNDWRGHNNNDWWGHNYNTFCSWYPSWWGWHYWCYSPYWGWWRVW